MAISFKPQIEAIQSVTASKMTDPRLTRRLEPGPRGFERTCNTILYYKGAEGYARVFAGLLKESLGRVFGDQPLFCGRIKKIEGGFELVSNDSGLRLIEAKVGVGLETYLNSQGRDAAEAELVQWKDVDEEDPQFSPLLYIQVTYFECGGFSVGISCSLLLADPLAFSSFLKNLETIHTNLFADENSSTAAPLSSLFFLHSPMSYPPCPYGIKPSSKTSKTVVFKFEGSVLRSEYGPLALLCVEEAETEIESESQMGVEFVMMVKDRNGVTEVESVAKSGLIESRLEKGQLRRASWDEFRMYDVMFRFRTVKEVPLCVSHWFGSPDGFVMVVASGLGEEEDDVVYVYVTI